jgi:acetate kinase
MAARNKVMVLNAGSSSLKFKLFDMGGGATGFKAVASGICERIGDPAASFLRVREL